MPDPSFVTLELAADDTVLALEASTTSALTLAATLDDVALSLLLIHDYPVVSFLPTTEDTTLALTLSVAPLHATLPWLAAAAHAATIAQETGAYSPILRVTFPTLMRTFSTEATLGEPLLARLQEGGVGAVSRSL